MVCLLCAATAMGQGSEVQPSEQRAKPLNPSTATALGGILGLGSGYYYGHSYAKGAAFTVIDGFALAALASGASNDTFDFGISEAVVGVSAGILAASHIVQALDGPSDVRRYNRKHATGFLGSPFELSVGTGLWGEGGSASLDELWAEGGASRDLAAAMGRMRQERPPLQVRFQVDSPGVMLGWQSSF